MAVSWPAEGTPVSAGAGAAGAFRGSTRRGLMHTVPARLPVSPHCGLQRPLPLNTLKGDFRAGAVNEFCFSQAFSVAFSLL